MSCTTTRLDPKTEEPVDIQFYDNQGKLFGRAHKVKEDIWTVDPSQDVSDKQKKILYGYFNLPVPQPVC